MKYIIGIVSIIGIICVHIENTLGFLYNIIFTILLISITFSLLDKQRFKCKHCNRTFIATSPLVDKFCNISNNTKLSIKLDLMNKISEKDIAIRNDVSHDSVNGIIDYLSKKLFFLVLCLLLLISMNLKPLKILKAKWLSI